MFGGSFAHSLDSAGRFVLPKKFRNNLGDDFAITKGLGCLCVFTKEYVDRQLSTEIEGLGSALQSLLDPDIVRLNRHFFGDMVTANADSQNRVQLTAEHRKYAGIENDVVVCGCGHYVELWSPVALEEYRATNGKIDDLISAGAVLMPRIGRAGGDINAGVPQAGPA